MKPRYSVEVHEDKGENSFCLCVEDHLFRQSLDEIKKIFKYENLEPEIRINSDTKKLEFVLFCPNTSNGGDWLFLESLEKMINTEIEYYTEALQEEDKENTNGIRSKLILILKEFDIFSSKIKEVINHELI